METERIKSMEAALLSMGFPLQRVQTALAVTCYLGVEPAMEWLLAHSEELEDGEDGFNGPSSFSDYALRPASLDSSDSDRCVKCSVCQVALRPRDMDEHMEKTGHDSFVGNNSAQRNPSSQRKSRNRKQKGGGFPSPASSSSPSSNSWKHRKPVWTESALNEDQVRMKSKSSVPIPSKVNLIPGRDTFALSQGALLSSYKQEAKPVFLKKSVLPKTNNNRYMKSDSSQSYLPPSPAHSEDNEINVPTYSQVASPPKANSARSRLLNCPLQEEAVDSGSKKVQDKLIDENLKSLDLSEDTDESSDSSDSGDPVNLQIRFPNGSSAAKTFCTNNSLQTVRKFAKTKAELPKGFGLAMNFPKRVFTLKDAKAKLIDLGLSPSAVLFIHDPDRDFECAAVEDADHPENAIRLKMAEAREKHVAEAMKVKMEQEKELKRIKDAIENDKIKRQLKSGKLK